jgi:hypothetical protein
MPTNDIMKEGLKITARSGAILYDSSWIAGVDYDHTTNNKENYENIENDEENEENNDIDAMNPNETAENFARKP